MIDDDEFLDEPDESGYRSSPKRKELATQLAYHAGRLQREGVPPAEVRQFLQGFAIGFQEEIKLGLFEEAEKHRTKSKQRGGEPSLKGVCRSGNKWFSQVRHKGEKLYLGAFATAEEADQAYRQMHIEFHGEESPYHPANQSTEATN